MYKIKVILYENNDFLYTSWQYYFISIVNICIDIIWI